MNEHKYIHIMTIIAYDLYAYSFANGGESRTEKSIDHHRENDVINIHISVT